MFGFQAKPIWHRNGYQSQAALPPTKKRGERTTPKKPGDAVGEERKSAGLPKPDSPALKWKLRQSSSSRTLPIGMFMPQALYRKAVSLRGTDLLLRGIPPILSGTPLPTSPPWEELTRLGVQHQRPHGHGPKHFRQLNKESPTTDGAQLWAASLSAAYSVGVQDQDACVRAMRGWVRASSTFCHCSTPPSPAPAEPRLPARNLRPADPLLPRTASSLRTGPMEFYPTLPPVYYLPVFLFLVLPFLLAVLCRFGRKAVSGQRQPAQPAQPFTTEWGLQNPGIGDPPQVKMLFYIERDGEFTRDDLAACCAHATLRLMQLASPKLPRTLAYWTDTGSIKTVHLLPQCNSM